ncbi:MAG: M20/M25/M40 family metallo-hydrolase [Pyrinomonadaceae bacterium]|nr:M20/M25/M40 family metallo-hydrolase [Pyrinomonadaceae bacterium]
MRSRFLAFSAISLFIAAAIFVFIGYFSTTSAGTPPLWISVDQSELEMIRQNAALAGDDFPLDVVAVQNGIAVVRADEAQMQKLSSHMHDSFQKCSGFFAHFSKEEALESIASTFAADLGHSFVDYTIDNQANVSPMIAEARETGVRQMIISLSAFPNRRYNQPSGTESANYIKNTWTSLAAGRSDISVDFFTHPTSTSAQPSIILTIQGTTNPTEEVVLGAHQDSINRNGQTQTAPGADDDASGIASLTEAIRSIVATGFRPARTVKFMAYAAEEVGLRGSNAIATDYRNRNVNVIGVMQLDMTNFKGTPDKDIVLITDFTNAAQNQFVMDLAAAYLPALSVGTSLCNYGCSDHASWTSKNYPSSFPFESSFNNSNSQIHTANDTISLSNNNADHALKFTKLALSFVGELAKGSIPQAAPSKARADFDGDGKTDVSVFRSSTGTWYMNRSRDGFFALNWGIASDVLVPADMDGDGKTDITVFRANNDPSAPDFYILFSDDYTFSGFAWGIENDIPVVADYDGDGKSDIGVFRPSTNTYYISKSGDGSVLSRTVGNAGDKPVSGDFDGDGKADLAVVRNDNQWIVYNSGTIYSTFDSFDFGVAGDIPTPADFDGDSNDDVAVFRPSNGTWYYLRPNGSIGTVQFGATGDVPVTGDYDGDGTSDYAVFRPSTGVWYVLRSSNSTFHIERFGLSSDKPIPFEYQH